jgi:hypothetical protein
VLWIFITHKNPPSSVGLEPATEYPVGPVASMLIAVLIKPKCNKLYDKIMEDNLELTSFLLSVSDGYLKLVVIMFIK